MPSLKYLCKQVGIPVFSYGMMVEQNKPETFLSSKQTNIWWIGGQLIPEDEYGYFVYYWKNPVCKSLLLPKFTELSPL